MPQDWALDILDAEKARALEPNRLFDLRGKTAVVTGATGGLGAWIAAGLGAAGAQLVLTDHPKAPLGDLAALLADAGIAAEAVACDLLEAGAAEHIADAARDRFGTLDVLVNNAGVNRREPIFDVSRENWDFISDVNLRVPYELSRAAAQLMKETGGGSIIHIASLNNAIGLDGVSVYGAHKAALCQLAKAMTVEWVRYGIRTNALCPGFMLTPLSKPLWSDPQRGAWIMDRSPMKRPGYPRELVGTCLLLASEAGSFITGQTLYVEGGWLAGTSWDQEPPA